MNQKLQDFILIILAIAIAIGFYYMLWLGAHGIKGV
jgi:hypothetical protein